MKKITILVLHLGYGGIEKAVTSLSNILTNDYEIEIISTYKLYKQPFFKLDPKIKVKYLIERGPNREEFFTFLKKGKIFSVLKEGIKGIQMLIQKKKWMIDFIKNCDSDIILSTRDIHNKWLSKYGKKETYKIGWEHNHHNNNQRYIRKIVKSVKGLDAFVLVSNELTKFYEEKLKNTSTKVYFIPNFLSKIPRKKASLSSHNLITVGRLSKEKGHLDLIEVMKIIDQKYKDFHLNIIGDGEEKGKIEKKIQKYHLEDKISLLGYKKTEEIDSYLLHSSIFLLPSYQESFGIVVLEAFSCGVPVIAFDSAKGALELISEGWDGYIIKDRDKEKMAKRIINVLKDENRRIIMGHNTKKKAKNYEAEIVKKKWIDLFEKGK